MVDFVEEYRYRIYGSLTVLAPYGTYATYNDGVICSCECGAFCIRGLYRLITGHTKSCGCGIYKINQYQIYRDFKEEYIIFNSMQKRCRYYNPTSNNSYFGKGIKLEGEWSNKDTLESFTAFIRDMGKRPSPDHEIDRIDVDKGYSKDNCRWVHRKVNALNKSNTKYLLILGTKIPAKFIADLFNLNHITVRDRLFNRLPFNLVFCNKLRSNQEYLTLKSNGFKFLDFTTSFDNVLEDTDIDRKFEKEFGEYILASYKEFVDG